MIHLYDPLLEESLSLWLCLENEPKDGWSRNGENHLESEESRWEMVPKMNGLEKKNIGEGEMMLKWLQDRVNMVLKEETILERGQEVQLSNY